MLTSVLQVLSVHVRAASIFCTASACQLVNAVMSLDEQPTVDMLLLLPGLMIMTRWTIGAHPAEAEVRCSRERLERGSRCLQWVMHVA